MLQTIAPTNQISPFHAGERALQARAGMRERIEQSGRRSIRDFMPDQHRELFAKLPMLVVGSLDARQRPWASVLFGRPGFITSPDPRTLAVAARPVAGDPTAANLMTGAAVGLLGIELATRRRNRMNGTVTRTGKEGFAVRVEQSFGNCPKYIQVRKPVFAAEPSPDSGSHATRAEGALLSARAIDLVRRADTFFIATAADGVDVSHRGGKPGFVRVTEQDGRTVLMSPDFSGNFFFNTLGNLLLNPRAGMVFVDFASGGLLSLTGEADALWDGPERAAFAGAERLLRFRVTEGIWIEGAAPLRWSMPEPAPQLAATGSWDDAMPGG